MARACKCVSDLRIQDVCQARFAANGVSHQCSRRAGHEEGRHRADACVTDAPEKVFTVMKRDRYGRAITIACPHCGRPVTFNPVKLEDGFDELGTVCPNPACAKSINITLGSLGGYIWPS